jgi:hypothetical protein
MAVVFNFDPTADSASVSEWGSIIFRVRYSEKLRLVFKSFAVWARNSRKSPERLKDFRHCMGKRLAEWKLFFLLSGPLR